MHGPRERGVIACREFGRPVTADFAARYRPHDNLQHPRQQSVLPCFLGRFLHLRRREADQQRHAPIGEVAATCGLAGRSCADEQFHALHQSARSASLRPVVAAHAVDKAGALVAQIQHPVDRFAL